MLHMVEDDRFVYVLEGHLTEKQFLKELLRARPAGYRFMPSYKRGTWDGYISLFKQNKFPAGLLPLVVEQLKEQGKEYVLERYECDAEIAPVSETLGEFTLRDYQLEAANIALQARRGVLHMATNAGKTLVFASIIRATGNNALVVVPSRALLLQTAEKLEEMLSCDVGRFGAGKEEWQPVTVTTMASMGKLVRLAITLPDGAWPVVLIVDECHHTRANTVFDNIFDIQGPFRFGVSGTPLTKDKLSDLKLIGATGPVLFTVTNEELVEGGYSTPPTVFFVNVDEPVDWDAEYDEAYRDLIVQNDIRNKLIAEICKKEAERGPILVLANWIEHVEAISYQVIFYAVTSTCTASGKDYNDHIQIKLDALGSGDLKVLIATDIFGEGIDIPSISTLVLAGGGKSHIKLLQRIGRGMRRAEGKDALHVYDFLDDTNEYLFKHSEKRYKLCKSEGFDVKFARL